MTDREAMQQALEALDRVMSHGSAVQEVKDILRERLAQPQRTHWEGCEEVHPECRKPEPVAWMYVNMDGECEQIEYIENEPMPDDPSITPLYTAPQPAPTIDKSAARRIATALGWVPPSDTSQERVDEEAKLRQEQEPVAKWDASAPLVVTPHPAFQATPPRREWVGLTDEERRQAAQAMDAEPLAEGWQELNKFARAIEAKLRERNNG